MCISQEKPNPLVSTFWEKREGGKEGYLGKEGGREGGKEGGGRREEGGRRDTWEKREGSITVCDACTCTCT